MKNILYTLAFLLPHLMSAQEFPLTLAGGKGTNVHLSLNGDDLTISMKSQDHPSNAGVYRVNICDINFIGGDLASYDVPGTNYYFLYVTFALKRGGRYEVLQKPSTPYWQEKPSDYENFVDGNTVCTNTNCIEFDENWREIKDKSCNTIFIKLQAFGENVHRLYEWKKLILRKLQECGSGKIVYKKYSFSCKDEKAVAAQNPNFTPHLDECEDERVYEQYQTTDVEEGKRRNNMIRYAVLSKGQGFVSNTSNAGISNQRASLSAEELINKGLKYSEAKNDTEALNFFRQAADMGDVWAQRATANSYERGIGAQKNISIALMYYKKAADQGDQEAKSKVIQLNQELNATPQTESINNIDFGYGSGSTKVVIIGNQKWSGQNLNLNQFANGDEIPQARSNSAWVKAGKNHQPAWTYYYGNSANGTVYGKLYNWYAVTDSRGLCPSGWHVPSLEEWEKLSELIGPRGGTLLKTASSWENGGNGTDNYGFSALAGGFRADDDGSFHWLGEHGYWWSSTEHNAEFAKGRLIKNNYEYISRDG